MSPTIDSEPTKGDSDVVRVLDEAGDASGPDDPKLTDAQVGDLLEHMITTRWLDERLTALQRQGRIGFHVGSLGEEGAIIGSAFAMREQDWLFPCYREFGAALLRGLDFQRFVDNMFGNENDTVKGRQMPDHYTSRERHWLSISSPVGTQITHAVGFAWAGRLRREDMATLVYFGDGATSSNDFHSGMNFAGVFKIPTVFFCRNNGWAISVPSDRQTASKTFAEKGIAYGIPSVRVDGNDIFAVVSVVRRAVERASRGGGATLIEALTYRMGGHSTSDDPKAYRETDDLKPWEQRDPIQRVRNYLTKRGAWTSEREEAFRADLETKFKRAVGVAEATRKPSLESMFDDVYAVPTWNLVEQRDELLAGPRAPEHS